MGLNYQEVMAFRPGPLDASYTRRDCIVYALGIGIGMDPTDEDQLRFVYEPKLTAFPTMDELAASLGEALEPRILWLDAQAPQGYVRDWHPPGIPALQNFAYAFEWWCFAVAAVVIWVVLSSQKPQERPDDR